MKKNHKIALTVIVVAVGVGLLLTSGGGAKYQMVDALMADPSQHEGKHLQVHGWVRAGTIRNSVKGNTATTAFIVEKSGKELSVVHYGAVPDTFEDNAEVVAEGKLERQGDVYTLHSDKLSAKCPSKYEGARNNKDVF